MEDANERPASEPSQSEHARHWSLDPEMAFLNHGAFGACPTAVLKAQQAWRKRLERNPVAFMTRDLEPALDRVRAHLATFVGAVPDDLALVPNATSGVNTVLRSIRFDPGDELLTTDHTYNAAANALRYAAARNGAKVTVAPVPFPLSNPGEVVDAVIARVTARTRIALVDHVTSPTGLVFPVEELVAALAEHGVDTLVDGAHAVGMLPLELDRLEAAYYTGNCHKWLCAPKGAAFLHVRHDRQSGVRPLTISHGANSPRTDRSRFRLEFDWMGTRDPTPWLCIPSAIDFLRGLETDGWPGLRRRNRALVLDARAAICESLAVEEPCPPSMIGSLASVPLPARDQPAPTASSIDPVQARLREQFHIEVPILQGPGNASRLLRASAAAYNHRGQYQRLAEALKAMRVEGLL